MALQFDRVPKRMGTGPSTDMGEPHRDAWTGHLVDDAVEVRADAWSRSGPPAEKTFWVTPGFEEAVRRHLAQEIAFRRWFPVALVAVAAGMVAAAFSGSTRVIASGLLLLGASILARPIANPIPVGDLGMRDSRRLARAIGLALVGLAVGMAFLGTR